MLTIQSVSLEAPRIIQTVPSMAAASSGYSYVVARLSDSLRRRGIWSSIATVGGISAFKEADDIRAFECNDVLGKFGRSSGLRRWLEGSVRSGGSEHDPCPQPLDLFQPLRRIRCPAYGLPIHSFAPWNARKRRTQQRVALKEASLASSTAPRSRTRSLPACHGRLRTPGHSRSASLRSSGGDSEWG